MKIHDLIQGSPEWLAYRATMRNASDAPAMMGCSAYKTRAELLREVHTGVIADVDAGTQKRYDNGHRVEALARPLAEEFIGEELYPVTGSNGNLSASFDGLTLDETTAFEHKALNDDLRSAFASMEVVVPEQREQYSGSLLPLMYRVQMEQQLLVSGAERVLFMSSAWTGDSLDEEHHCWYYPHAPLRRQIVDGWAQFERDLSAYELPPTVEAAPVGKAPDTLPALRIEVTGAVTASNLAEFKATALGAIRSVNRTLTTDQDFADAEKAVKWCADVESRIKAAKEHALSQTASIDALFKTLDDIATEARTVRLDVDKLVSRRKVEVKEDAVVKARRALDAHIATLNAEIAPMRLPAIAADFAGCIKGLKSLQSIHDKLDGLLATAKIAAEADARAIRENVTTFEAQAAGLEFLFADLGQIVHKAHDDFAALVTARIATHKAAEAAREEKRKADEAARIAAAEQRAREQESERIAAEQRRQDALAAAAASNAALAAARQSAAAVKDTPAPGTQQVLKAEPATADATDRDVQATTSPRAGAMGTGQAAGAAPAANEPATLNLGAICGRLGFTVSAGFLADVLHVKPAVSQGRALLYTERQFAQICRQIMSHVSAMAELYEVTA